MTETTCVFMPPHKKLRAPAQQDTEDDDAQMTTPGPRGGLEEREQRGRENLEFSKFLLPGVRKAKKIGEREAGSDWMWGPGEGW